MRHFNRVPSYFWTDPVLHTLSVETRLIALYLATGPHSNLLGCFRLSKDYVSHDLNIGLAEVKRSFQALAAVGFFTFDEGSGWCVVHDFLKWNTIQNGGYAKAVEKLFKPVPRQGPVFKTLCALLLYRFSKYLSAAFKEELKTAVPMSECAVLNSPLLPLTERRNLDA